MIDLSLMDKKALAKVFDYSVLPKETQEAAIRKGCVLTRQYQFAAFYSSSPFWAPIVKEELADFPDIEIGTGISFPWGSVPASVKALETEEAVKLGCTAVDICIHFDNLYFGIEAFLEDSCENCIGSRIAQRASFNAQ